MVIKIDILRGSLIAAACSALFSFLIWWLLDRPLPFMLLLSPFFLLLSIPVGVPILLCGRYLGRKSALWAAAFSALLLYLTLPDHFVLVMVLQVIGPAAFMAVIADLRSPSFSSEPKSFSSQHGAFIPLSAILSSTVLLVAIASLIWAACLNNVPQMSMLLDRSIVEISRILTITRTLLPDQISQFDMMLRSDDHALIIRLFAFYGFSIAVLNFYIASRLGKNLSPIQRPRDDWPEHASCLPRIQVILLVGSSGLSLLPIDPDLRYCLDIVSQLLLMSFTLTGLAAIHLITRGKSWRPFLLTALYGLSVPLFASFILALWGIFVSTTPLLQKYKSQHNSSH